MNKLGLQQALDNLILDPQITELFSAKDLQNLATQMEETILEVLGDYQVQQIEFAQDEKMYCCLDGSKIHIGLGMLKNMIKTWSKIIDAQVTPNPSVVLKQKLIETLNSDAAHEAGHAVIDCHPINDLQFTPDQWNQLGLPAFANALMDCRNDQWTISKHPQVKDFMLAGLEFNFGPGGRQDWVEDYQEQILKNGFHPRFIQFSEEAMRLWARGEIHPQTDLQVQQLLQKHQEDILFIAKDPKCSPSARPSKVEKKAKARQAYQKILEIFNGDYQQLLKTDRENQAIHQILKLLGIFHNSNQLPKELTDQIMEHFENLPENQWQELIEALQVQKITKQKYLESTQPAQQISQAIQSSVQQQTNTTGQFTPNFSNLLTFLGPAINPESLTPDLRATLLELFKKLQQQSQQEQFQQMLQQLLQDHPDLAKAIETALENEEKQLKDLEDQFSNQIAPKTIPKLSPTHQELDQQSQQQPNFSKPPSTPPPALQPTQTLASTLVLEKDFAEAEAWLEKNIDLHQTILDWREAIYAVVKSNKKPTPKVTNSLHINGLIHNQIAKQLGLEPTSPEFQEKTNQQQKITISILWRTVNNTLDQALKLFLFLKKIYEDPEIKKYLDLEILVSQQLQGLSEQFGSPVPVILAFGQDPIIDHDQILHNFLQLEKQSGSTLPITGDADALKTQRERLLKQNPGTKRKYAIDLWDQMAVQAHCQEKFGTPNAQIAVQNEIAHTKEALKNRVFCFALGSSQVSGSSPATHYGPGYYAPEQSTEKLLTYLDKLIKNMIKYPDNFAEYL